MGWWMSYPLLVSGPGGDEGSGRKVPERLISVGLEQKRSPALLGGERGFGKLVESVSSEVTVRHGSSDCSPDG